MKQLLIALAVVLVPSVAQAYVGPGAGLGMIGSLLAVVGAILLAVFGLVLLPLRMMMRKRRRHATVAVKGNRAPD